MITALCEQHTFLYLHSLSD